MRGSLEIRAAQPEDCGLVLDFIRQLAVFEKLEHEVSATEEQVRETLFGVDRCAAAIVGFWEGEPAGFAVYFFAYSTFRAQPVLYLEDLFVKPEFRSRGIGKAFFAELLRVAKERNCGRFEWSVLDWNARAIKFYESLGAKPQKEWIRYRLDQEQICRLAETGVPAA